MSKIICQNLKLHFVNNQNDSGLNISLKNGDKIGLLGGNGSGKTTLLKTIIGIYPPLSGSVYCEGKIGQFMSTQQGFRPNATVKENILIMSTLNKIPKKKLNLYASYVLDFSELESFANIPIRKLSAGMKARLAFSCATFEAYDILIFDEWIGTADKYFTKKANFRINDLMKNKIIILASHNQQLLDRWCNKQITLNKAKLK
jgi:lipopolysaccharide transport system ATP-binding protein